jgi:DNA primase
VSKRTVAPYEKLADRMFDVRLRSGDEWSVLCPLHQDHTPSFSVNVRSGLYYCHVCKRGGHINKLASDRGFAPADDLDASLVYLRDQLDAIKEGLDDEDDEDDTDTYDGLKIVDESLLRRYEFDTDYWRVQRKLSDQTIAVFQLGYDPLTSRPTIPLRSVSGDLLGVIVRKLDGSFPKYKNPPGFTRTTALFGSWLYDQLPADVTEVAIVEGPVDAIKCWQAGVPALAQFGSSLSEDQVDLLHRLGVYTVTLFYDNDKGGYDATLHALPLLGEFRVKLVGYESSRQSDPGKVSDKGIRRLTKNATPLPDALRARKQRVERRARRR